MISKRGFTDTVYLANFICVNVIVGFIIFLTAFSGKFGITDMSALSSVPPYAYAELGIHSAVVAWKNKCENIRKMRKADENTDYLQYL